MKDKRKIILVGDKVLIDPSKDTEKTEGGLYLPAGVKQKEKVQGGYIVKTGPGFPMPAEDEEVNEPWESNEYSAIDYLPLQAQEGDYALFLKKNSIEIEIEKKKYLIIPHHAILVLMREDYMNEHE